MGACRLVTRGANFLLLGNQGLEGEAEFCDFAAVPGSGSTEDLVAEAEVAVLFAPVNLGGQGVDHAKGDNRH